MIQKIDVINLSGERVETLELHDHVFGCDYKIDSPADRMKPVHQVIRWQMSKRRGPTQHIKNRSEVVGAHRKRWAQKESGRARQGDGKACHWRGGGAAFAISNRDYSFDLNKKYRALAMRIALTHKLGKDEKDEPGARGIIVIQDFRKADFSKTKKVKEFIENQVKDTKVLFVTDRELYKGSEMLGLANLPYVNKIPASGLNVLSMSDSTLVFDKKSIMEVQSRFIK